MRWEARLDSATLKPDLSIPETPLETSPKTPPGAIAERVSLRDHVYVLFALVGVFWVIEVLDYVLPVDLDYKFGLQARTIGGAWGILFAPFLHANFSHLMGNTVPFLVLGGLVMASGVRVFVMVFWIAAIVGGLGTWLLAPQYSVHVGASGVIFGFLGFLLMRAWFGRRMLWMLIAVVAAFLYGGLVFTLLRQQEGISWHGHFFGFLGGVLAAWLLTRKDAPPLKF